MAKDDILEFKVKSITQNKELKMLRFMLADGSNEVNLRKSFVRRATQKGDTVMITTETGQNVLLTLPDESQAFKVKEYYA